MELQYEKDSKERMPWEHYTQEFATADPQEIASRLSIPYDEEAKKLTLTFLGTQYQITWPDFEVTHTPDDKGFYPLENMIYARILTIRFLLNGVTILYIFNMTAIFKISPVCQLYHFRYMEEIFPVLYPGISDFQFPT